MSAFPPQTQVEGALVVANWGPDGGNEDDYFLDLTTMQRVPLGSFAAFLSVASGDGTRLAYFTADFKQLAVRDLVSGKLVTLSLDSDYGIPLGWLDREHVLFNKIRFIPFEAPFNLPSLLVLDPFTGERREFAPEDYPLLYDDYDTFFDFGNESRLIPDPTLTRLVYAGLDDGANAIILWDLVTNRELTRIHTDFYRAIDHTPRWSPDGSRFVINAPIRYVAAANDFLPPFDNLAGELSVGGTEFLIVDRDGRVSRVTYVTNTYNAVASGPAWSPDGRHIAYWLNIFDSEMVGERLAVVDTATGQVTNYCVGGYREFTDGQSGPPIWSPDGKFLAVTVPDPDVTRQLNIVAVDLRSGIAVKVAENAEVAGWLIAAP